MLGANFEENSISCLWTSIKYLAALKVPANLGDATGAENNMSWGPFLNYVIMFLPISYQLSTTTLVSVSTKYGRIWVLSF